MCASGLGCIVLHCSGSTLWYFGLRTRRRLSGDRSASCVYVATSKLSQEPYMFRVVLGLGKLQELHLFMGCMSNVEASLGFLIVSTVYPIPTIKAPMLAWSNWASSLLELIANPGLQACGTLFRV